MIPYGRHSVDEQDIDAVVSSLRSDWLTTGPLVEDFERKLEEVVGSPAISVSSGTAALHCAYAAIGLKAGEEVITPPITFVATQATAAMLGAKVVFCDVSLETGNIDPHQVERLITSKTKALVAVDYAGHPCDMDDLREIADRHGIYLIEDAAHSIGSTYRERPVGSLADLTTFSFYPTKNITTGEGGAVASPNPELLLRARRFARQGLIRENNNFKLDVDGPWHQEVHEFGLNYRLPDVLCALGISQLSKLPSFKKRRRSVFNLYKELLAGLPQLTLPIEKQYVNSNWHLYPLRVQASQRRELFEFLRESGFGVQVNYIPAYRHPVFSEYRIDKNSFPNSERFYSEEISLPMHVEISDEEVNNICQTITKFLSR
jgi:UDP-4-amino-4,6-dideoxy-N-acetyl-beta-L-altrosamine transaminase